MEENKNKKLIVPFVVVSLLMVLIITGGLSYAYFTWWGTPGGVQAVGTATYPGKANRTCTVAIKDAANVSNACNLNMVITYKNMNSATVGNLYSKNCAVIVTVNGLPGDKVTYSIGLKAGTPSANTVTGYTFAANEFTYQVGTGTEGNLAAVGTSGTTILTSKTLTVATANTAVTNTDIVTVRFRNLDKNQTPLTSLNYTLCSNMNAAVEACHNNTSATTYIYYLYTPTFTCTIS